MDVDERQLYSSPNGDRSYLVRDGTSGQVFVPHEANLPSGGTVSGTDIGTFFSRGMQGSEHEGLVRLIGTLLEADNGG